MREVLAGCGLRGGGLAGGGEVAKLALGLRSFLTSLLSCRAVTQILNGLRVLDGVRGGLGVCWFS